MNYWSCYQNLLVYPFVLLPRPVRTGLRAPPPRPFVPRHLARSDPRTLFVTRWMRIVGVNVGDDFINLLASLYRDECSVETDSSSILSKMVLHQITTARPESPNLLPASVRTSSPACSRLGPSSHQKTTRQQTRPQTRNAPETVLGRAMMEHSVTTVSGR